MTIFMAYHSSVILYDRLNSVRELVESHSGRVINNPLTITMNTTEVLRLPPHIHPPTDALPYHVHFALFLSATKIQHH